MENISYVKNIGGIKPNRRYSWEFATKPPLKVENTAYSTTNVKKGFNRTHIKPKAELLYLSLKLVLTSSIRDWTLVGEDDKKLAIKSEIIDTLNGSFVNRLLTEATKFNNITPEEVKNLGGRLEPQLQKQV